MADTPTPAAAWYTVDAARKVWADAPKDADRCAVLLEVAKEQVEIYAPELPADAPLPHRYPEAQIAQAVALWQAYQTRGADTSGFDMAEIRRYPMDATVQTLLRPKRGTPLVG